MGGRRCSRSTGSSRVEDWLVAVDRVQTEVGWGMGMGNGGGKRERGKSLVESKRPVGGKGRKRGERCRLDVNVWPRHS